MVTYGSTSVAALESATLIEVFAPLKEGDTLVRRAIDEIRDGSKTRFFVCLSSGLAYAIGEKLDPLAFILPIANQCRLHPLRQPRCNPLDDEGGHFIGADPVALHHPLTLRTESRFGRPVGRNPLVHQTPSSGDGQIRLQPVQVPQPLL